MKIKLFALLLVACIISGFGFSPHKKLQPDGSLVKIPVAGLQTQKASYYRVLLEGREIRFFAVKGSDGKIRTALDACDACYREKKGYDQKGTMMICRNCGMAFPVDRIGPSSVGGCNPHHLPSRVEGDKLVIAVDELRKGVRFFP